MRVRETRGELDFAEEPLGSQRRGQLGPEDLDRHLAMVLEVFGEIDRGHAARTQLFLDGVAVGEGGLETIEKVRHCVFGPAGKRPRIRVWASGG